MFDVSSPVEDDCDSKPLISETNMTPRTKRKFDSVRNLLEKARAKLSSRSRSQSQCSSSDERLKQSEPSSPVHVRKTQLQERLSVPETGPCSQSSPNTPLMNRRLQSRRHQSFSPVRTLLNSPLLRRKKSLYESSDEDISESDRLRNRSRAGYQNLETFQKQKLKQKVGFIIH